ncbi:hypothetical protein GOBAR_AA14007 [Gossypium barbadense]|uniref:non-specific serine/threonine protein kinase n=1 Tax=Gossypium barbadense TaxID=3634 RepID=A0A2P5XTP7_GOSBA|nr:hypothetical protein GOBAR_AA14007 [Gossypium barbadense]
MESLVISSSKSNPPSTSGNPRPSRPPSPNRSENEKTISTSHVATLNHGVRIVRHPNGSIGYQKHSSKPADGNVQHEELPDAAKQCFDSSKGKSEKAENKSSFKHPIDDHKSASSSGSLESEKVVQLNNHTVSRMEPSSCPNPALNMCTGTHYAEAKPSFTNTEVSEYASSVEKSGESGEVSNSFDLGESRKTSIYRESTSSDVSDESSSSFLSSTVYKPHKANDIRWEAIQAVRSRKGDLDFKHFRVLKRLGCGDIGSVYLSELTGTKTYFAMKVMDKALLASRKKLPRAQTEREILQSLDHPFLPTLYTHFETQKLSCLVMEFCPGGDLHALRQRQPGKYFSEQAARFYVAEVLLALEYLHMLGIIYRDLKPENVLVREDGHIMLSDFDLSLRCSVSPSLVKSSNSTLESKSSAYCAQPACTHEYLAPEIIKGEGHGSAVDWWTFGIFLYELLFGKTPFKGAGNRATLFNVVGQPLRFPEYPSVSFAAKDLIRGLLVKEPQHRLAYRRGATEIKQHPFFQSVNWALIRCANPPDVPKQVVMDCSAGTNSAKVPPTNDKVPGLDVKPSGNYLEIDFF